MFAPDVVYSSRNRTPTPFPLLAGMNFCASAFKGAAILFVLYQSIACRARDRFCDRAEPAAGPWEIQCLHKRGIRLPSQHLFA